MTLFVRTPPHGLRPIPRGSDAPCRACLTAGAGIYLDYWPASSVNGSILSHWQLPAERLPLGYSGRTPVPAFPPRSLQRAPMACLQVGREFLVLPTPGAGLLLPGHLVPGGDVGLRSCRTAPRSKRRLGRRVLGVMIRSLPPTPRNARRVERWHLDVLGPPNPADGNGLPRLGAGVRGHRHGVHLPSQKTRDATLHRPCERHLSPALELVDDQPGWSCLLRSFHLPLQSRGGSDVVLLPAVAAAPSLPGTRLARISHRVRRLPVSYPWLPRLRLSVRPKLPGIESQELPCLAQALWAGRSAQTSATAATRNFRGAPHRVVIT